ncbi:hypothetical protein QFC22_006019 [Naganishia vaughanmartiniae]|uniref:Uncharacterized protein n=1 Tax=Naganishia vaughanmartiniae TaxID=1424756 RepID=A0ACC2WPD6_9TREE|nr:hypothetical protein QFC22_006019 [Naganishia vaughanmartiniae]
MSNTNPQTSDPRKLCIPWQTWKNLVKEHGGRSTPSSPQQQTNKTASTSFPGFNIPVSVNPPSPSTTSKKQPSSSANKPSLPPGIVLDENGKPCKICNSWQTWAKIAKKQDSGKTAGAKSGAAGMATGMFGAALGTGASTTTTTTPAKPVETEETSSEPERPPDCPPDVAELGRATWTFLHTTAAYYPATATPAQQTSMRAFIAALGDFYPCSWCATDFREKMRQAGGVRDVDVSGRDGLEKWFCDRHNEVNRKLGKQVFDCRKVGERWRDGPDDGRCD